MALTKTPQTMISGATVAAGSSAVSAGSVDLSGSIDFGVGYVLTFNASATGYARLEVYADPTASNPSFSVGSYDDPVDSYDIQVDAGHKVSGVVPFTRAFRYGKLKITNSTGQSLTGVSLYAIVQSQA